MNELTFDQQVAIQALQQHDYDLAFYSRESKPKSEVVKPKAEAKIPLITSPQETEYLGVRYRFAEEGLIRLDEDELYL